MPESLPLLPLIVPEGESDSISSAIPFELPLLEGEPKDIPVYKGSFDLNELAKTANPLKTTYTWQGGNTPEQIADDVIRLFSDAEILKGDAKFVEEARTAFAPLAIKKIAAGKRIEFVLLGMPHRIPNPLKTSRPRPDFGEVAALIRLAAIMRKVQERYAPGAFLTVVAEGTAFENLFGISKEEILEYRDTVARWIQELGFSDVLGLVDLKDVMESTPGYVEAREKLETDLRAKYLAGDKEMAAVMAKTLPTIFFSFNVRNVPLPLLREIYAIEKKENEISTEAFEKRMEFWRRAHESVFPYMALHGARRIVGTEKHHYPDAIPLTVTPKSGRLGIHTVNAQTRLLPHHGNAVLSADGSVTVRYEFDIARTGGVQKVLLPGEQEAFAYVTDPTTA